MIYEIKTNPLVCLCIFSLNSIRKYKNVALSFYCTDKLYVFSFITHMSYKELVQFKGDVLRNSPTRGQPPPPFFKSRDHTQTHHIR